MQYDGHSAFTPSQTSGVHAGTPAEPAGRGMEVPTAAIGGSYTGSEGQAFFALAIGRRVDLRVRPR